MKTWVYSIILISSMLNQNSCIDKLKTTEEVTDYIKQNYPGYNTRGEKQLSIKSTEELSKELNCEGLFSEWDIKNWEKVDLNNDGRTDLLAIIDYYGTQTIAVLDLGNDQTVFKTIKSNPYEPCQLVKPIKIDEKTRLKISHSRARTGSSRYLSPVKVIDTLSFFKKYLVEYNAESSQKNISSIFFETTACFGECPEFKLELTKDGYANFNGIAHTPTLGKSKFKLAENYYSDLEELLKYINVVELKSDYSVNWTDDQTGILSITFEDGGVKTIKDYGMKGTYGLSAVYQELMNLVKTLNVQ